MDKKDKMQKEAELEAREEALEEEALPVEDAADASQAPKGPTQEELDGFLRAFDACYTRLTQL